MSVVRVPIQGNCSNPSFFFVTVRVFQGLTVVDARISASEKDLPVQSDKFGPTKKRSVLKIPCVNDVGL